MPQTATNRGPNKLFQFIVTFAIVYLLTTMTLRIFFPEQFQNNTPKEIPQTELIQLIATKKSAPLGRNVEIQIRNQTLTGITLTDRCPEPPVIIERMEDDHLYQIELKPPALPCVAITEIPANETVTVDLSPWKYSAFAGPGRYQLSLPIEDTQAITGEEIISTEIRITKPGVFVSLFRAFISKPLFNGLILIASVLPGHSLGWSIILLTLIVRLLLFFPSQHALESQKKMQSIQPKIEEIKKKYKDDQQKITQETMALWKREKINPFQSCLPTLIQIPILLGLFFIIRDSDTVELAKHLLYPPFLALDWSFSHVFLGVLDLGYIPYGEVSSWFPTPANIIVILKNGALPLTISLMQFVQMKMTFAKKPVDRTKPLAERMDAQTMMLYMLPIMIFLISGSLPAAVSLYWGTSTLFSIGQQVVVNRKK